MTIFRKTILKASREYRHKYRDMRGRLGLDDRFYKNARGGRIMIYHGICQRDHTRYNSLFIKYKTFEAHLKFYKKYFHIISLDDYFNRRFSEDRFNICITFDDGFANNHKYVLPLLEKYSIPAAFFITAIRDAGYDILWNDFLAIASRYGPKILRYKDETFRKGRHNQYISQLTGNNIKDILRSRGFEAKAEMMQILASLISPGNKIREQDYWLQMTADQIRDLSASPFATIGCHGYYHNDLAKIDIQSAAGEITKSKQYLENITGKEIKALAFPYGAYTRGLVNESRKAGYSQLLAMEFNFPEDMHDADIRERFGVNPFISIQNQMYATINARYE